MDKLNCFKKPQNRSSSNHKKVCLYQDDSSKRAAALKKRRQSRSGSSKPGFHFHHSNNDSSSVRDSMQYYRIWIYSCNMVLGLTSVIFIVFAAFVLADVRLSLLRGFEFYHPTFLYAYIALILQCGIVQTIGCFGATRLSHKLLSIYWILLLILTLGDIIVGLVWVFKLDEVKLSLRPSLTKQFLNKYSIDGRFTEIWNTVQAQEHCCGVDGPIDFDKFITSSIIKNLEPNLSSDSNVSPSNQLLDGVDEQQHSSSSSAAYSSSRPTVQTLSSFYLALPDSCCMTISYPIVANSFPLPVQQTTQQQQQPGDDDRPGGEGGQEEDSISRLNSIVKRQIYSSNLFYQTINSTHPHPLDNHSVEDLLFSSRFVNSKQLTRHGHHLRHFIHPRKSSPQQTNDNPNEQQYSSDHHHHSHEHDEETNDDDDDELPIVLQPGELLNSNNNEQQMTEILIPFSCRNPLHNSQVHNGGGVHHHHLQQQHVSNLPSHSFNKSPEKSQNRRSTDQNKLRRNNAHHHRPGQLLSNEVNQINEEHQVNVRTETDEHDDEVDPISSDESNNSQSHSAKNKANSHNDGDTNNNGRRQTRKRHVSPSSSSSPPGPPSSPSNQQQFKNKVRIYRNGCYTKLNQWLDHVSGILFILGFCIIGFVKICFVIILRYEISEMIEKIHVLETEGDADAGGGSNSSPTRSSVGLNLLQKQHSLESSSYNRVLQHQSSICGHFNPITGITIKSPEHSLSTSSPFINHCASHLYHHHHHLPPYYAQQHRHSTTPYWNANPSSYNYQQHRASHCSGVGGVGMLMNTSIGSSCGNGRRRPSGRSLNEMDIAMCNLGNSLGPGGGDVCCSNHSQETVNMTLLITTPTTRRESSAQNGDRISELAIAETCINASDDRNGNIENISLKVPVKSSSRERDIADPHEQRRNNFANHYCWDSNVSCDSSTSNIALDGSVGGGGGVGRDHSSSSSLQGLLAGNPIPSSTTVGSAATTHLVKVDMENHRGDADGIDESLTPSNIQFIDEDQPPTISFSNNPMITYEIEQDNNGGGGAGGSSSSSRMNNIGSNNLNNDTVVVNVEGASTSPRLNRQQASTESSVSGGGARLLAQQHSASSSTGSSTGTGLRRNGNNNSVDSGQSVDSDYIMSFIGTAV